MITVWVSALLVTNVFYANLRPLIPVPTPHRVLGYDSLSYNEFETMNQNILALLPMKRDIESVVVLKKLAKAHTALAELKGVAASIPNQSILINTLSLQEAKDSSAIENIVTTHDNLYRDDARASCRYAFGQRSS